MKNDEKRQRVVLGIALWRFLGDEIYNGVKIGKKNYCNIFDNTMEVLLSLLCPSTYTTLSSFFEK